MDHEHELNYEEALRERRSVILNSTKNSNYDSKTQIIKLLELEYEDLEKQHSALMYSNDEMLKVNPSDSDLIECREENIKYIQAGLKRMKEIIEEVLDLDRDNRLKDKQPGVVVDSMDNKYDTNSENNVESNTNNENNIMNSKDYKNTNEIIDEIEL